MEKSPEIKVGKYQHYKGQFYQVLYLATHSETSEKLVVYQPLYGEQSIWVRPYEMFFEEVVVHGKRMERFKFVSEA